MIKFAWMGVFAVAPLPLLVRLLWRRALLRQEALTVPFYAELERVIGGRAEREVGVYWVWALYIATWLLLLVAAARPQWLGEAQSLPVTGRDLMLAVDVSGSMEIPDLELHGAPVSRLQVIQNIAGEFIARRVGDRVGLILFGTRAYVQTPLTFDRGVVRSMLNEAEIGIAGKETAIGDAIALATKHLRDLPQESRVLILLTDGANTAGALQPRQAAELAAKEQLRIYTIGVGADTLDLSRLRGNSVLNMFGRPRIVNPSADLDEEMLQYIARTTGGRYFRAKDSTGLQEIYRLLDTLEPQAQEQETFRPVDELYYWPLGAALLLTLVGAVWRVPRKGAI